MQEVGVYTSRTHWERCSHAQLDFKRVTATTQCCWGVACDHHIYLNVQASTCPIRYQGGGLREPGELCSCFWCRVGGGAGPLRGAGQAPGRAPGHRWFLASGGTRWTGSPDRLLPSDRWQWSDVTGLEPHPLNDFLLPSTAWEWEGDWSLDHNFEAEPTEKGGWTYAMDFPAYYTRDKKWNSCVRRRRWLREEPRGRLSLWAVTLQGKVWYREGIQHHNPEGSSWVEVTVPGEVAQISCGPADLLWAVLWEGQLLVREGISRDCPRGGWGALGVGAGWVWVLGTSWTVVDSPSSEVGLTHVAVGVNVGLGGNQGTNKGVWFRRGVNSHNPRGSGWISMVGEMLSLNLSVSIWLCLLPWRQVWALGSGDRAVYQRQGVTPSELSGKAWRAVTTPRDTDRSHSSTSGSSSSLHSAGCFFTGEVRGQSAASDPDSDVERDSGVGGGSTASPPTANHLAGPAPDPTPLPPLADAHPRSLPKVTSDSFISELISDREEEEEEEEEKAKEEEPLPSSSPPGPLPSSQSRGPLWTNVDLEETRGAADSCGDTCSLSSVVTYSLALEEEEEDPYGEDGPPMWAWLSGGGCDVDAHSPLSWFGCPGSSGAAVQQSLQSLSLSVSPGQTAAWHQQILDQLDRRSRREVEDFRHYEQAVEQSVWVKKGTLQWWRDWKPHRWVEVRFALEQFSGPDGKKDGILFLYYTFNEEKKILSPILYCVNEVTILVPVLNDAKHTFAVYTAERTRQRWPIRLAASTEQEMHDWLALLTVSCCDSRGLQGAPSRHAVWSVTCRGDVFVSEPTPALEATPYPTPCGQMFWRQVGGHLAIVHI
ncbi:hypothetical protein CRUP_001186, partial [Coryphaenoides rupestris]